MGEVGDGPTVEVSSYASVIAASRALASLGNGLTGLTPPPPINSVGNSAVDRGVATAVGNLEGLVEKVQEACAELGDAMPAMGDAVASGVGEIASSDLASSQQLHAAGETVDGG